MAAACASPLDSLPHTIFPDDPHNYHHQQAYQQHQTQHVNFPPPPPPRTCFSPQLTRDYYQTTEEENANLQYQVSDLFMRNLILKQLFLRVNHFH